MLRSRHPAKNSCDQPNGDGPGAWYVASRQPFPRFIATKGMQNAVGADLREKLDIPLKFQWSFGGAGVPPATTYGYDAEVLIEVCQAIMRASNEGELKGERHAKIVRQAQIIVGASAKNGIRTLVYALSGYNPSAEEVIAAFKLYIQDEARKYEPEFPNELYMAWHRLYQIPVPVRGKPWHFKHLTVSHIYHPLAKSQGKILSLLRALKSNDGARQKKLFQFLNEVGARALRMHLGRVLEMAESSADKESYEKRIRDRFGNQHELNLILPSAPIASLPPSTLSNSPAPA